MLTLSPTFDGKRTVPNQRVTKIMGEMLALTPDDKLLEIGTGSGFQTAEWAKSGAEIHSIELEPWVDSTVIVGECVYLHSGDGHLGLPQEAPFTAIVATCGIEQIPREWIEQLAEGGRLVVPIGSPREQALALFTKRNGDLDPKRTVRGAVRFQMLREKPKPGKIPYQAKSYASSQ
jgi:protein-L-isoaspartate(D-aspartate) O-methyltransferase